MSVSIVEKEGKYGIIDNNTITVPRTYDIPRLAILEWKWFQVENLRAEKHRKFLDTNRSEFLIMSIVDRLLEDSKNYN